MSPRTPNLSYLVHPCAIILIFIMIIKSFLHASLLIHYFEFAMFQDNYRKVANYCPQKTATGSRKHFLPLFQQPHCYFSYLQNSVAKVSLRFQTFESFCSSQAPSAYRVGQHSASGHTPEPQHTQQIPYPCLVYQSIGPTRCSASSIKSWAASDRRSRRSRVTLSRRSDRESSSTIRCKSWGIDNHSYASPCRFETLKGCHYSRFSCCLMVNTFFFTGLSS